MNSTVIRGCVNNNNNIISTNNHIYSVIHNNINTKTSIAIQSVRKVVRVYQNNSYRVRT